MVPRIRNFAEGLRRRMAIMVRCGAGCGKSVMYPARDFDGYIAPMAEIEDLKWRCSWCGRRASYVRWCLVQDI